MPYFEGGEPISNMPKITKDHIHTLLEGIPVPGPCWGLPHIHIALILKRGKLLAWGTNQYSSRSMGCGSSTYSCHAEAVVIKRLGNKAHLRGAVLVVVRPGTHTFNNSEPCDECKIRLNKHMREDGLVAVYYSV
jgi:hypothetical protein